MGAACSLRCRPLWCGVLAARGGAQKPGIEGDVAGRQGGDNQRASAFITATGMLAVGERGFGLTLPDAAPTRSPGHPADLPVHQARPRTSTWLQRGRIPSPRSQRGTRRRSPRRRCRRCGSGGRVVHRRRVGRHAPYHSTSSSADEGRGDSSASSPKRLGARGGLLDLDGGVRSAAARSLRVLIGSSRCRQIRQSQGFSVVAGLAAPGCCPASGSRLSPRRPLGRVRLHRADHIPHRCSGTARRSSMIAACPRGRVLA